MERMQETEIVKDEKGVRGKVMEDDEGVKSRS